MKSTLVVQSFSASEKYFNDFNRAAAPFFDVFNSLHRHQFLTQALLVFI